MPERQQTHTVSSRQGNLSHHRERRSRCRRYHLAVRAASGTAPLLGKRQEEPRSWRRRKMEGAIVVVGDAP